MSNLTHDWQEHAKSAVVAIEEEVAPRLKRVADDLYADLLYSVQVYLLDNVLHNVRARIEGAERQASIDRQRVANLQRQVAELLGVARRLAALESGDGGRAFPTKEDCAAARAAIAKAEPLTEGAEQ